MHARHRSRSGSRFVLFRFSFYTKTIKANIASSGRKVHQQQMCQKSRQNYAKLAKSFAGKNLATFLAHLDVSFFARYCILSTMPCRQGRQSRQAGRQAGSQAVGLNTARQASSRARIIVSYESGAGLTPTTPGRPPAGHGLRQPCARSVRPSVTAWPHAQLGMLSTRTLWFIYNINYIINKYKRNVDHTQCLAKKETSKCARKVAKTMPAQLAKSWSPRRIRQVAKTMPAQLAKSWSTGHTFGQLCWHSFLATFLPPCHEVALITRNVFKI